MRRELSDDILRSALAVNAALQEALREMRRALDARREEAKYNPNWRLQPRAPKGTSEGGQWVDGGALAQAEPTTAFLDALLSTPAVGSAPIAFRLEFDTNGIPTPGWAEPDWGGYPARPRTSRDGDILRMSPEAELAAEAILGALNAMEELEYRRVMGRSVEDSYELRLIEQDVQYLRNVPVMTREGLRIYDFMQRGPLGWEFVEVKANRAIATPRQCELTLPSKYSASQSTAGHCQGFKDRQMFA